MKNYFNKDTRTYNYFTDAVARQGFEMNTEELNQAILTDFYHAVEWLFKKEYEEYRELESNTINPAQQNAFKPLRIYRVKRNGHYKIIKIYSRFWGGCWISEEVM